MMELYLYLKNKERHILERNPLKGSPRNVTWKAKTATSVKRMARWNSLRLTEDKFLNGFHFPFNR